MGSRSARIFAARDKAGIGCRETKFCVQVETARNPIFGPGPSRQGSSYRENQSQKEQCRDHDRTDRLYQESVWMDKKVWECASVTNLFLDGQTPCRILFGKGLFEVSVF